MLARKAARMSAKWGSSLYASRICASVASDRRRGSGVGEAVAVVAVVAECRKSVVAVVVAGGVVVAEVVAVVAVVVVENAAGALASAMEVAGKGEGMDESGNAVGEVAGWGETEEVGRLEVGARDGAGGEAGESVSEDVWSADADNEGEAVEAGRIEEAEDGCGGAGEGGTAAEGDCCRVARRLRPLVVTAATAAGAAASSPGRRLRASATSLTLPGTYRISIRKLDRNSVQRKRRRSLGRRISRLGCRMLVSDSWSV